MKMLLIITLCHAVVTLAAPPVQQFPMYNNVDGNIPNPGQSFGSVHFLGVLNSTDDCMKACLRVGEYGCYSFTYHTEKVQTPYARHCYGVINDPIWSPTKEDNINSGRILWPCRNGMDCSLNGECMINGKEPFNPLEYSKKILIFFLFLISKNIQINTVELLS